jgi:hypothetical protein
MIALEELRPIPSQKQSTPQQAALWIASRSPSSGAHSREVEAKRLAELAREVKPRRTFGKPPEPTPVKPMMVERPGGLGAELLRT